MSSLSSELERLVQKIVEDVMSTRVNASFAIVTAVHPEDYTASVVIQPSEEELAHARIATSYVGEGFGINILPRIGDEAIVVFPRNAQESAIIVGFLHNKIDTTPLASEEEHIDNYILKHSSGASIQVKKDGTIFIDSSDDSKVFLNGKNLTPQEDYGLVMANKSLCPFTGLPHIDGSARDKGDGTSILETP